jgi:hypothetical protein
MVGLTRDLLILGISAISSSFGIPNLGYIGAKTDQNGFITANVPGKSSGNNFDARVGELADPQDLGSCVERRDGSSPSSGI